MHTVALSRNRARLSARLLGVACSLLFALPAEAQTASYLYQVEEFEIVERSFFDTFDDGVIGPDGQWFSLRGNITESGGAAILTSPGETGFLDPLPLSNEATALSSQFVLANGFGDFNAISTWTGVVPDPGTAYTLAFGFQDQSTGDVTQVSIGVSSTLPGVAAVFGSAPGLNVNLIQQTRSGAQDGPVTSFDVTPIALDPLDIFGQVQLSLMFDDSVDQLIASFDTGGTSGSFAGVAWDFIGGGFSLVGSSTVPEPSTALLLGLGLMAFGLGRRRAGASRG